MRDIGGHRTLVSKTCERNEWSIRVKNRGFHSWTGYFKEQFSSLCVDEVILERKTVGPSEVSLGCSVGLEIKSDTKLLEQAS